MLDELLGPPLAAGRTAEIYRWKQGKVLKLYREGCGLQLAEREAQVARDAHIAGLPVPHVGNIVEVERRVGLEYDFLDDASLLRSLANQPWTLFEAAREFANLHLAIHKCHVREIPSQRVVLTDRIREAPLLSRKQKETMLHRLDALPDGDRLCHGDLHPDNVLIGTGGLTIVDWADASSGNPLADVAKTSLLLQVCPPPCGTPRVWMLEAGRWAFRRLYLHHYFAVAPCLQQQFEDWFGVVAAARLADGAPEEFPALLKIVESNTRLAEATC